MSKSLPAVTTVMIVTALLVRVRSLFYILLQAKQDFAPAGVAEREIRVTVGPNRCR
jgi:hypothetical protein